MVTLLLQAGVDREQETSKGRTALDIAKRSVRCVTWSHSRRALSCCICGFPCHLAYLILCFINIYIYVIDQQQTSAVDM